MTEIREVFELVELHSELADTFGPAAEDEIRHAERQLGLRFPTSYRRFVARYGTLSFAGIEFYGLMGRSTDGIPNVVWATRQARLVGLPVTMIEVMEPGIGDIVYCIDTSRADDTGEAPVVECILGAETSAVASEPYAESFSDFAMSMLKLGLETEDTEGIQ